MTPTSRTQPSHFLKLAAVLPITVFVLLVIGFFTAHQIRSTGLFLPTFGPVEALLLYCSIFCSVFVVNTAGVDTFGLKKELRFAIDVGGGMLATITTALLLLVFPFDFAYFASVVPAPLQFLFSWVTNSVAQDVLALLLAGSAVLTVYFVTLRAASRGVD